MWAICGVGGMWICSSVSPGLSGSCCPRLPRRVKLCAAGEPLRPRRPRRSGEERRGEETSSGEKHRRGAGRRAPLRAGISGWTRRWRERGFEFVIFSCLLFPLRKGKCSSAAEPGPAAAAAAAAAALAFTRPCLFYPRLPVTLNHVLNFFATFKKSWNKLQNNFHSVS